MTTIPASRRFIWSAWAVPVLIVGQFAFVAIVPVGLALSATLRDENLRPLRRWAVALATAYAAALAMWAMGPDRAQSLSKDLHPALAAVICAVAVGAALAYHVARRSESLPAAKR